MRVLVTGAAGFIGGHLAGRLRDTGHGVVGVDKRVGLSTADLPRLTEQIGGHRPDLIAHLGANCSTLGSLGDPSADFVDNAAGTFNVCEASRRHGGIPIIFLSSVKSRRGTDGLLAPLGLSKRVGEHYLRLYRDLYGVPHVINRPSTVYGPGQDATAEAGWFTWFIRSAEQRLPVTVAGDGTQSRDVLYIDDMIDLLVDQIDHFAAYADGPVYDVGGGAANEVSLNALLAALDHRHVTYGPARPGDLQRVVCDNTAVGAVNGWRPQVGWRDGLERVRRHLRGQR